MLDHGFIIIIITHGDNVGIGNAKLGGKLLQCLPLRHRWEQDFENMALDNFY